MRGVVVQCFVLFFSLLSSVFFFFFLFLLFVFGRLAF